MLQRVQFKSFKRILVVFNLTKTNNISVNSNSAFFKNSHFWLKDQKCSVRSLVNSIFDRKCNISNDYKSFRLDNLNIIEYNIWYIIWEGINI